VKVLLALHGYPPELVGGTESAVQALAHGLLRRGHEPIIVAGSMDHAAGFRVSESRDDVPGHGSIRVLRIHRADLYFDHWHKSASGRVEQAFREILRAERPALVHVHHWIRLSRGLVATAARERIPAVVTLHDLWTTCLVTFRVRTDTQRFCAAPLAPSPCLACAGRLPPFTRWVDAAGARMRLAEHKAELARELALARGVLAVCRTHGVTVERMLELPPGALRVRAIPPGRDVRLAARAPLAPPARQGKLAVACWGHLSRLKGADVLLEALRRVPDPSRIELRIAGGEVEPAFAARVHALAAGLDVRFYGAYGRSEDLQQHPVAQAHVFATGTRAAESWGLVVDEATQLGLPVVVPRSGAFTERLVGEPWGLYYEPCDPDSLARVLWRLVTEPETLERLRRALPVGGAAGATVDEHVERTLDAYHAALELGPPPAPAAEWWRERMLDETERGWDDALRARSAPELGFA
jgi:glycosyltransferase involved in cell wall biosynthesis